MIEPEKIRSEAISLGFSACGIARSEPLNMGDLLDKWTDGRYHGSMGYMEKNTEKRLDPSKLFPGAKSAIVLAASYFTGNYKPEGKLKISRYAAGRDYHRVLRKKGQALINWMTNEYGPNNSRIFVDSAPLMEKVWARKSGIGWLGKNTCLIIPGKGSWFFLGVILTDLELQPDKPEERNLCGKCTACIDACPTAAINPDGFLDSRKCISYLTIESKNIIPDNFKGKTDNWLFGCDICQEVCPHNRFAIESVIPDFQPREISSGIGPEQLKGMEEGEFDILFSGSPLKRAGLEKLKGTSSFLYPDL